MMKRSLSQLSSLTWITFLESLRHRAMLGLMLTAVGFMAFGLVVSALAVRDQAVRVATNFGLFALGLIGVVTAIIMGTILVYKEIQRRTIYTVLSKPVPRPLFVLGKYFGLAGVLAVMMVILGIGWFAVVRLRGGSVEMGHVAGVALILLEVLLITAVAVFFQQQPWIRPGGEFLAAATPDLTTFQIGDYLLLHIPIGAPYMMASALYALSYIALFLCLGILVFQVRDFI